MRLKLRRRKVWRQAGTSAISFWCRGRSHSSLSLRSRKDDTGQQTDCSAKRARLSRPCWRQRPTQYAKSSLASSMDSVFLGHFELAATHLNDPGKAFTIIEGVRGRSIADTLRFRPVNRGPEPASLTRAEKEISRLRLRILKAGAVERKRLMTESAEFRAASRSDRSAKRTSTAPSADATDSDHASAKGVGRRTRQFSNTFSRIRPRTAWPSAGNMQRCSSWRAALRSGSKWIRFSRPFERMAPRESRKQRCMQRWSRRWKVSCLQRPD